MSNSYVKPAIHVAYLLALSLAVARGDTAQPPTSWHGSWHELKWSALPEFGGRQAVFFQSPDGKRIGAAFEESGGPHRFTWTFDEVGYVRSGKLHVVVKGGPTYEVAAGEVFYFREGMTADLTMTPDFQDVTFLSADHPVSWQ